MDEAYVSGIVSAVVSGITTGAVLLLAKNSMIQAKDNLTIRFDGMTSLMRSSEATVKREIEQVDKKVDIVSSRVEETNKVVQTLNTQVALMAQEQKYMSGQVSTLANRQEHRNENFGRVTVKD